MPMSQYSTARELSTDNAQSVHNVVPFTKPIRRASFVPEFWWKELSHCHLRVMLTLQSHDNRSKDNYGCFPSRNTIAEEAGLDKTAVARAIVQLEKLGVLERETIEGVTFYHLCTDPNCRFLTAELRNPQSGSEKSSISYTSNNRQSNPQVKRRKRRVAQVYVSKIVGPINRHQETVPPSIPSRSPRKLSPRDQTLRELWSWFSQACWAPLDFSRRGMRQMGWLYDRYGCNIEMVQQVCREAYEKRDKLLTEEYPVWGLQTVWFYVNFKRKEESTADHIKMLGLHAIDAEDFNDYTDIRAYIKLHGVSRETVRGTLSDEQYRNVYAEDFG